MLNIQGARDYFRRVDSEFGQDAQIFLVGETTQLLEGWQRWVTQIDFYSVVEEPHRASFNLVAQSVSTEMQIHALDEFPGDVVPLAEGFASRSRPLTDSIWDTDLRLVFSHFDPYSVSYRYIMRGGETDYALVLRFLEKGWITEDELDSRLDTLLPELTFETIQQDPAELRRRYSGLKQMWRARQREFQQLSRP